MSGAQSISTRRAYGVPRVCRVWHCARSSVYARRQVTPSPAPCRRRGPVGAAPDDVLVAHVRRVLEASPFHGEGYRKVVPLRDWCNFGRSSWLISQALSVTYVPREHRLYLERSCRPLKIRPQQTAAWRGACLFQRG